VQVTNCSVQANAETILGQQKTRSVFFCQMPRRSAANRFPMPFQPFSHSLIDKRDCHVRHLVLSSDTGSCTGRKKPKKMHSGDTHRANHPVHGPHTNKVGKSTSHESWLLGSMRHPGPTVWKPPILRLFDGSNCGTSGQRQAESSPFQHHPEASTEGPQDSHYICSSRLFEPY